MQSSRLTLVEILLQEFTDPEVKKKCLESSLMRIRQGITTRAFDDFPSLLTQSELTDIAHDFQIIFEQITNVHETDNGILLGNLIDQISVQNWEKIIAIKACKELLDNEGKVKSEIVDLLGWEKYIGQVNNCDVVCAYVAAVNHLAMLNLVSLIQENQMKFTAVCDYVNSNYRGWIKEVMQISGFSIDPKHEAKIERTNLQKILYFPIEHPAVGIGIGITALLLAGLTVAGILLFGGKPPIEKQNKVHENKRSESPGLS